MTSLHKMSSPRECHFCCAAISGNNFVSLVGKLSTARDWPCRISKPLLIRVASDDGLPAQIRPEYNFRKQVREGVHIDVHTLDRGYLLGLWLEKRRPEPLEGVGESKI